MKVVFYVDGKPAAEFEPSLPVTFVRGGGYVLDDEAYRVSAVTQTMSESDPILCVHLDPQTYCDDCGMATTAPSNRPLCICEGAE